MATQRIRLRNAVARAAATSAVVLALVCGGLWLVSYAVSVGRFSLGSGTSLRFANGVAEVSHYYAYDIAPPVPRQQWHDTAVARGWTIPTSPGGRFRPPTFHFSTGHVAGVAGPPGPGGVSLVSPANYWLLRVPLWALMIPGLIAGALRLARRYAPRHDRRQGFEVTAPRPQ